MYIVLSLIGNEAYRAPKYRCSDENKAYKVNILLRMGMA